MGLGSIGVTAALLWGALASPALAQDPGVIVDPNSPSGKEYAIPLENARAQAAIGVLGERAASRHRTSKRRAAPLFGVGISVKRPGAIPKISQPKPASKPHTRKRSNSEATASIPGPSRPPHIQALVATPDSGTGDIATLGAGGGAVLLLGGLLGIALRRRSRGDEGA